MGFEAFDFLMVHQIHVLWTNRFKVKTLLHRHCGGFDPVAIFPMARDGGDFTDVDFRVEVGCKGLTMVAAIAIQNIEGVDAVEVMLFQIGREHRCHAGVEA